MRNFLKLNVDDVISDWQQLSPSHDEIEGILEVAYLTIAADGVVTRTEMAAFAAVMEQLFGAELTAQNIEEVLDQFEESLDKAGFHRRLVVVSSKLKRFEVRDKAYQLAYAMAMCDLDTNVHEFEFDKALRDHLGLEDQHAEELVDAVVDLVMKKK